jgi:hypothetical protein
MTSRKALAIWCLCLAVSWGILELASLAGMNVFKAETVSGVVSFKGEPLARGVIYFSPMKEGEGVLTYGWIKDGRYTIEPDRFKSEDHSVRYQVSVIPITKSADGHWKWMSESPNAQAAPPGEFSYAHSLRIPGRCQSELILCNQSARGRGSVSTTHGKRDGDNPERVVAVVHLTS